MEPVRAHRPSWVRLSLTGLIAIVLLAASSELIARRLYTETEKVSPCLVLNEPATGIRAIPNCACMQKTRESSWVQYRYNACGNRDLRPCNEKSPGVYRIVLIGSSLSEGFPVRQDQSYAAILPTLLSRDTGKNVEIYNEAIESGSPHVTSLHFEQALKAKPDLFLWVLTPWDILNADLTVPGRKDADNPDNAETAHSDTRPGLWARLTRKRNLLGALSNRSRAFFMVQHLLYKSSAIYVAHSLTPDEYTSSLQNNPGKDWQAKLARFDAYYADIAARAQAAGVPIVVSAIPRHAQAVMIASGDWPPGLDPYAFGDQIKSVVEKHGGTYVDVLHDLKGVTDMNQWFFAVDQHLTVTGQKDFAFVLAKSLTNGAVPALTARDHTPATMSAKR